MSYYTNVHTLVYVPQAHNSCPFFYQDDENSVCEIMWEDVEEQPSSYGSFIALYSFFLLMFQTLSPLRHGTQCFALIFGYILLISGPYRINTVVMGSDILHYWNCHILMLQGCA